MTLSKRILCGFALALLVTVPVLAKVVTSAERSGNFTWTGTSLIPLTDGGADVVAFSGKARFVISYSAECDTTGSWVSIQILLDGTALAPTAGTSDAFCSNADGGSVFFNGWTTANYTVATKSLSSGAHTVQIQGTVVGTGQGHLGDSSLVIQK